MQLQYNVPLNYSVCLEEHQRELRNRKVNQIHVPATETNVFRCGDGYCHDLCDFAHPGSCNRYCLENFLVGPVYLNLMIFETMLQYCFYEKLIKN